MASGSESEGWGPAGPCGDGVEEAEAGEVLAEVVFQAGFQAGADVVVDGVGEVAVDDAVDGICDQSSW